MKWMIIALSLFSLSALAGESGYISNGEAHVVFRDGKKVGEWPESRLAPRKPSSVRKDTWSEIYFEEDSLARCYWQSGGNNGLQCVRK